MLRANSLKRAVRLLVEHTEKVVDEQNKQQGSAASRNSLAPPPTLNMDMLKVNLIPIVSQYQSIKSLKVKYVCIFPLSHFDIIVIL